MKLTHKVTVRMSAELYDRLVLIARAREISVAELIRRVCEKEYAITSPPTGEDD